MSRLLGVSFIVVAVSGLAVAQSSEQALWRCFDQSNYTVEEYLFSDQFLSPEPEGAQGFVPREIIDELLLEDIFFGADLATLPNEVSCEDLVGNVVNFSVPFQGQSFLVTFSRDVSLQNLLQLLPGTEVQLRGNERVFDALGVVPVSIYSPEGFIALMNQPEVLQISEELPIHPFNLPYEILSFVGAPTEEFDTSHRTLIAVMDTGIDAGAAGLEGAVVYSNCFSRDWYQPQLSLESSCSGELNELNEGPSTPCSGLVCEHGSEVASIISSLNGVAFNANLYDVKVFGLADEAYCNQTLGISSPCAVARPADILNALVHLSDFAKMQGEAGESGWRLAAVNLSLGTGEYYDYACDGHQFASAVNFLYFGHDVLSIVAAGNAGLVGKVAAPACVSNAITVSALDPEQAASGQVALAPVTNVSGLTDFVVPGSATSYAAPIATAAVAWLANCLAEQYGVEERMMDYWLADSLRSLFGAGFWNEFPIVASERPLTVFRPQVLNDIYRLRTDCY